MSNTKQQGEGEEWKERKNIKVMQGDKRIDYSIEGDKLLFYGDPNRGIITIQWDEVVKEENPLQAKLARLQEENERLKEEREVCEKCGNNSKEWPDWKEWQEKLLPVLTRFANESPSALNYGDVWNAMRKYAIHPLEARIAELEQGMREAGEEIDKLKRDVVYGHLVRAELATELSKVEAVASCIKEHPELYTGSICWRCQKTADECPSRPVFSGAKLAKCGPAAADPPQPCNNCGRLKTAHKPPEMYCPTP